MDVETKLNQKVEIANIPILQIALLMDLHQACYLAPFTGLWPALDFCGTELPGDSYVCRYFLGNKKGNRTEC